MGIEGGGIGLPGRGMGMEPEWHGPSATPRVLTAAGRKGAHTHTHMPCAHCCAAGWLMMMHCKCTAVQSAVL